MSNYKKSYLRHFSSINQRIWICVLLLLTSFNSIFASSLFDWNFSFLKNQMSAMTQPAVLPSLSVNNVSLNEGNNGPTRFFFTVSLSAPADQPVSVSLMTADGTAVAGEDYSSASGTLTFAPGETSKSPVVTVIGDNLIESDETFTINLSNAVNATISGGTGTGTILNDDRGGYINFFNSSTYLVSENAGTATITVGRLNGEASNVSIDYSTSDGTAIAGQDYVATSGTLTFAANETTKTFTVPILNDSEREQSETINLTLSNPNGVTLGTESTVSLTIIDDEMPPFSIGNVSDREGNGGTTAFNFTVTLLNPSSEITKVDFATADGAATSPSDFQATSGTLIFPAGVTTQIITVLVNGDTQIEEGESFTVNLSNAVNATILNAQGTGFIQDDDRSDVPPPCMYSASQTLFNVGAEASTDNNFYVSTNGGALGGCYFTASADNPFVTITSFNGLSGARTISFNVAANTGAARTAKILINGTGTVTINQVAGTSVGRKVLPDFDGDGKADISVFRPSNGYWYISKSSGGFSSVQWGIATDTPVPGDYDGDGKTDFAVYREFAGIAPPEGVDTTWYILRSSDNTFYARQWGRNTPFLRNAAVPADYDGDGKTDLAVYTLSDAIGGIGIFQILQSSNNTGVTRQWGYNTDIRVPRDYDGDGKTDLAVVRNGVWYILQSSNAAVRTEYFGLSTDRFVPSDYDGDGKADIAVWRPSNGVWYRINSSDNSFVAYQFGLSTDTQVPADYDGDGKTDIAVFRPSTGVWYLQQSTRGFRAEQFGLSSDILVPSQNSK